MKCPKCGNLVLENKKYCNKCGYSFKLEKVFEHENLELQVLTKCGIIVVFIIIIFSILHFMQ